MIIMGKDQRADPIDETLAYYDRLGQSYVEATVLADMSEARDRFLGYLSKKAYILDLGCGSGRDSRIFKNLGYPVKAVDGSNAMCAAAAILLDQPVSRLKFENLSFDREFDAIWACASLLHIPSKDLPDILTKVMRALKPFGIAYFSFKHGCFEGMRHGRYFTDLDEATFRTFMSPLPVLIREIWISDDVQPDRDDRWLNAIVQVTGVI